jgi:hypothetical protein
MKIKDLKGGSLSTTELHEIDGVRYVKKKINLIKEREYGFVRWYSQLKKIQRYSVDFPSLFPKIINVSYETDNAVLTLQHMDGFRDIKTILSEDKLTEQQIIKIVDAVWKSFALLHSKTYSPIIGAPKLYYKEEVRQKLNDALMNEEFLQFFGHAKAGVFEYNGEITHGIFSYLDELENVFFDLKLSSEENIHGNPTLENMLYSFEEDRVVFIDLYEESMMDTKFLDYAQVLQCSRSHYGYINDRDVIVTDSSVSHNLQIPKNFEKFNFYFELKIPNNWVKLVDILEATQFIRMLPFKCRAGEIKKAKFFYVHACNLLGKVLK